AGQHGLEMRSSNGEIDSPDPRADFNRIAEELARVTEKHRALIAELKGNSVALHYRRAPQLAGYAHRVMRDLQTRYGQGLVIQKGKRVVELRPEGADKGQAIRSLMQRPPFKGRMPAFVGDDVTDEHGFKVVNEMGGISVKVGKGKSDAQYRLESVSDVREWIARGLDLSTANGRRHGAA
ncbi:MAG TPA: trehalose-phosphatase, partial [Gemmatimonadaceae bacterium]